jgi:hypothetical protein
MEGECFMKNTLKVLGIICLALIIGLSMAACGGDDDDDDNGKQTGSQTGGGSGLTVQNPPATGLSVYGFIGKAAPTTKAEFSALEPVSDKSDIYGYIIDTSKPDKLFKSDMSGGYGGSDNVLIIIEKSSVWKFVVVKFSNGSATVDWATMTDWDTLPAGGSGGGELPAGAVTGLTVDSALVGTWTGAGGTLIFTATGVGSPESIADDADDGAAFVYAIGQLKATYGAPTISGGKISGSMMGYAFDYYTYTVSGNTLTIKDEDGENTYFTGTKQ